MEGGASFDRTFYYQEHQGYLDWEQATHVQALTSPQGNSFFKKTKTTLSILGQSNLQNFIHGFHKMEPNGFADLFRQFLKVLLIPLW